MRTFKWTRKLVAIAASAGIGAAVAKELQKPPEERTWRGKVFGLVPYDVSPVTLRGLPRRGARAIINRSRDLGRTATKSGAARLSTVCSSCGARFDPDAHQVEVPDPDVDATQSTASVTRAKCPRCGSQLDPSKSVLHARWQQRRSLHGARHSQGQADGARTAHP
jgi:DNA-directed RNA polymerase subunit RPC12/RpoP